MVRNDLSTSTHSLRGTSSTLSLRQAAITNRELEQARRTIKDLEEQNKKLERENEKAKKRSAIRNTPGAAGNTFTGPTDPDFGTLIDFNPENTGKLPQRRRSGLSSPEPALEQKPSIGFPMFVGPYPYGIDYSSSHHQMDALSDTKVSDDLTHRSSPWIMNSGNDSSLKKPYVPFPYDSANSPEIHPVVYESRDRDRLGFDAAGDKSESVGAQDEVFPDSFYKGVKGKVSWRVDQNMVKDQSDSTAVKDGQFYETPGYGPVPTLLAAQGSFGNLYPRADVSSTSHARPESTNSTGGSSDEKSLFQKYMEDVERAARGSGKSLIAKALSNQKGRKEVDNKLKDPMAYAQPFCEFLTENPTVWHAVGYFENKLEKAGFQKLSERKTWNDLLATGGKYYISRNGSSLVAFTVGSKYKSGNGVAMVAGHVDALTARLKPISNKKTSAGYVQLGVAPYAGALNSTWWDRDLGVGGRVLVKDEKTGKIITKLVKLGWPIARIPTLAPHFGIGMTGQENKETQTVPIIGLDNDSSSSTEEFANLTLGAAGTFAATQPPKLVRAIAGELSITDYSSIVNWELELFDTQPAQIGGLEKEFIFGGRIDDKICSWAAMEGLLAASASPAEDDGLIKLVGVFDDEEIGSLLRQGAKGNFLPSVIERITESFAPSGTLSGANLLSQTYANSFLISADVTHAVNPNFLGSYLENHAPRLNVGLCVCADSNGHMTTDSVSTALLTRIAEKSGDKLQLFMIRNDSRSGGTVGPMLSSAMGVRAIDAGIPQLSMHSIRATVGNLDPGLGVKIFAGFFEHFESVDQEFE